MTKPLAVEFAGVPGSGKTSLSTTLASHLRSQGFRTFTVVEAARIRAAETAPGIALSGIAHHRAPRLVLWWLFYLGSTVRVIPFFWSSRRESLDLARLQFRRKIRPMMKSHIAWWFMQLGGRRRYLDTSDSIAAVLYDDGFVHRSVALFSAPGEPAPPASIETYIDMVPRPAAVVHVRADPETCLNRVMERGVWKHSKMATAEELENYVRGAVEILDVAVAAARRHGVIVIEVENDDEAFDTAAEVLTESLRPLLESEARREPTA